MNHLALFVKERRKRLRLTQEGLAERAGVGLRFVRELEQGKTTLRCDRVNQVLALFGARLEPVAISGGQNDSDRNEQNKRNP